MPTSPFDADVDIFFELYSQAPISIDHARRTIEIPEC